MSNVLELLRAFNRKERYFLLKEALGTFDLSEVFRQRLGTKVGLQIPQRAFVAMDYHMEWLYASLYIAGQNETAGSVLGKPIENVGKFVQGNQEDIDLLVAFDDGATTHVIVIEAKGVTGWTNSQLESKANRLREIFGDAGAERANVVPHFVLMSPRESKALNRSTWPAWMREQPIDWLPLPIPPDLLQVSRANSLGTRSKIGTHWVVLRERTTPLAE